MAPQRDVRQGAARILPNDFQCEKHCARNGHRATLEPRRKQTDVRAQFAYKQSLGLGNMLVTMPAKSKQTTTVCKIDQLRHGCMLHHAPLFPGHVLNSGRLWNLVTVTISISSVSHRYGRSEQGSTIAFESQLRAILGLTSQILSAAPVVELLFCGPGHQLLGQLLVSINPVLANHPRATHDTHPGCRAVLTDTSDMYRIAVPRHLSFMSLSEYIWPRRCVRKPIQNPLPLFQEVCAIARRRWARSTGALA